MLADHEIETLIRLPKDIVSKTPAVGYKNENRNRRCELDLMARSGPSAEFSVFIRQNDMFIENFSIGLRYKTKDRMLGTITLVRYNGPHGETRSGPGGHFGRPHIHRVTSRELAEGNREPQERHREITDRFSTYEEALLVFFADIASSNHRAFFGEIQQLELFNGH